MTETYARWKQEEKIRMESLPKLVVPDASKDHIDAADIEVLSTLSLAHFHESPQIITPRFFKDLKHAIQIPYLPYCCLQGHAQNFRLPLFYGDYQVCKEFMT